MRGLGDILAGAVKDVQTFLNWANRDGFDAVNSFATRTGWLHPVMVGYATYGVVGFAVLLLAGWWLARRTAAPSPSASSSAASAPTMSSTTCRPARRMAAALWAPAGMLIALGLNQVLVAAVHEPRPYTVVPGALVLVARSTDYAFPSDHAVMAGAVAAGAWLVSRRLGLIAAAAAVLMGFARVYVGAHWPGDVLVGLIFGATVAVVCYLLVRTPLTSAVIVLARTRLRPLLTAHPAAPDSPAPDPDPAQGQGRRIVAAPSSADGAPLRQEEASVAGPAEAAPPDVRAWATGPRETLW